MASNVTSPKAFLYPCPLHFRLPYCLTDAPKCSKTSFDTNIVQRPPLYLNSLAVRESLALCFPLFDLCAIASSSCRPLLIIVFVTVLTLHFVPMYDMDIYCIWDVTPQVQRSNF